MATTIRMLPLNALRSFDAAARHLSFAGKEPGADSYFDFRIILNYSFAAF